MHPELNAIALGLSLAAERAPKKAEEIIRRGIGEVSDTMRSIVPVNTGATRDSISDNVFVEGGRVVGESGPSTPQALFAEFGTSRMAPEPFAGPALEGQAPEFEKDMESIVDGLI